MRAGVATLVIVGAVAALVALGVTDQVIPATDDRTLSVRPWVAARALGITAYLLLTLEVAAGVWLSHPRNSGDPRTSRVVFPWHELLTVFTAAFLTLHIVLLAVDPYAGVDWIGAFVPGFSQYRPIPVAIGSVALYAMIITAATAKWTRLLPAGWWLRIHRLTALVFLMAWVHGILAGTDTMAFLPLYLFTGGLVLLGIAHRWWSTIGAAQRSAAPAIPAAVPLRRREPATASEESR
ncbi:MAG TPA: ferric reductase-like transmembrane domain-containing protein [Candidatus Limnocylindrales bacterium]